MTKDKSNGISMPACWKAERRPMRQSMIGMLSFIMGSLATLATVSALPQLPDSSSAVSASDSGHTTEKEKPSNSVNKDSVAANNESLEEGALYTDVGKRPDWLANGSSINSEQGWERLVIMSEPRLRELDAEEELERRLVEAIHERVDKWLQPGAGKAIGIDLKHIQESLIERHAKCDSQGYYHQLVHWKVPDDSREAMGSETGEAIQYCASMKLDGEFKDWIHEEWESHVVASRTMQLGLLAASSILCLSLVFFCFKVDHKTRGFYSGRLQSVGLVGMLFIGGVAWWLATRFAWL